MEKDRLSNLIKILPLLKNPALKEAKELEDSIFNRTIDSQEKLKDIRRAISVNKIGFWQHITLLLVTIVGFSVALHSQSNTTPSLLIRLSLGLMVVSVIIGLVLIREQIEIDQFRSIKEQLITYDYNTTLLNWMAGKLNHKEASEIITTIVLRGLMTDPVSEAPVFKTKEFKDSNFFDLLKKYEHQIPSVQKGTDFASFKFIHSPSEKFFAKNFVLIVSSFYLITALSLVVFLLSLFFQY